MSRCGAKLFIYSVLGLGIVLNFSVAVSNYNHEKNQITEVERRGAEKANQAPGVDQTKSDTHKRALFSIGSKHSFSPSSSGYGTSGTGYGHGYSFGGGGSGFSSSGSGYGGHHGYHSNHYLPPTGVEHGGGHGGGVGHHGGLHSSLALKGLLIPIAGIALLGAAAALSTNPVLLQLGVINGRRKRSVDQVLPNVYPKNPVVRPENV